MSHKHLATYLNDHLAGSVTILELLSHLASAYAGTDVEPFATQLHADVLADRKELENLMARLQIGQSAPRKTSAWLAEKVAQLKLRLDDLSGGAFRLQEATEAISVGIEGKRLLWVALSAVAEKSTQLRGLDYQHMIHRAEDQRQQVEAVRIKAATEALGAK